MLQFSYIPVEYRGFVRFLIVQKLYNMKKRTYVHRSSFRIGELYLFHTNHPLCPSATSLWGFYDKTKDGSIILEHSTQDLHHFRLRHYLSKRYRYYRLDTRAELRDYMYNLGVCDSIFFRLYFLTKIFVDKYHSVSFV